MKRFFPFMVGAVLFLSAGALALIARSGGLPAPVAPLLASPLAEPSVRMAPQAGAEPKFNVIAMPLDAQDQFDEAGKAFDADGLAAIVGGVQQVMQWNAALQNFEIRNIDPDFGNSGPLFPLKVGGVYWVLADGSGGATVSFVGDVPPQSGQPGAVSFTLERAAACRYNHISLPLDKSAITNADQLAAAIGGVVQVMRWNASLQNYEIENIDPVFGNNGINFETRIGYPYMVCTDSTAPASWP